MLTAKGLHEMSTIKGLHETLMTKGLSRAEWYWYSYRYLLVQRDDTEIFWNGYWQLLTEKEIVKELLLVILLKIVMVDTYLDEELIHL